jgi:hypothetical protein
LCPGAAELKRLTKDIDSSWLRFAPDVSSLSAEDLLSLRTRSVILTTREFVPLNLDPDRKGFLVLDVRDSRLDLAALSATMRAYAAQLRQSGLTLV